MKRVFFSVIILILMIEILWFPKEAMHYAATGLTLWFQNIIPALFPFMVISGLIVRLDLAPYILILIHPFFKKIFRMNVYCEYAVIMGFLCGYPMGALIVRDLLKEHKITTKQGDYLLSFCNNIGPVFFCSLVLPLFKGYTLLLLSGMYLIPFLYGIIMRYTIYKDAFITKDDASGRIKNANSGTDFYNAFTESLNQAVNSSLYLGACMIFFNMLRFMPARLLKDNILLQAITAWCLEVNGALSITGELYVNMQQISLCLLSMFSIGGLSCMCQTMGILSSVQCNLKHHFMHKILQALLWLFLTLLWLRM